MLLCLQPEQNPQPQERIQIGLFSFSSQVQNDCVVGQPSGYSTLSIFINILKTQKTIYFFQLKNFLMEIQIIYQVVLVSGIQESDSVICTYIHMYIHICTYTHTYIYIYCCCSFPQSCLTLCNPTCCSMQGCPVLHQLLDHVQTHVHQVSDAIQLTLLSSVVLISSCLQTFPASGSFPMSQLFA